MKKLSLIPCLFLAVATSTHSAAGTSQLYFGQEPPGDVPVVFAPGIISREGRFEQFLLYSPDGSELVYSITNADWSAFTLESIHYEDGEWSEPETSPFLGSSPDGLVAAYSYDMQRAFFVSSRPAYPPANIWMSERKGKGWAEPVMVGPPVSSDGDEFEVAIAENGTLYFSSGRNGGFGGLDLYRAIAVDGAYPTAENLGPVINSSAGDDLPYIAPDESYLIFGSDRKGSYGRRDLYVSFKVAGEWTPPLNLGPNINTERFDSYPFVSLDGEYLFFTRRTEWRAKEDSDIYWVSTAVIDRLRERAVVGAPRGD